MDAIRIARAYTKRDTIMKIFGSYHGHHDGVMVSIGVEYDKIGDRFNLESLPYGAGIPQAVVDLTIAVPFNDAEAMEHRIKALDAEGRKPACVIMEAAMMNLGVVLPEPGYLEAVREITQRHGIVLIFDEVKTGLCIAPGGATEQLGRAAGHGHARQGARRRPAHRRDRRLARRSCRWWRTAASSRSAPTTATRSAWRRRGRTCRRCSPRTPTSTSTHLNGRILGGCEGVIERHNLPGYAVGVGSKGCVTFSPEKIVDYETFKANQDADVAELAWLFNMNRGIFMTPGREEEWTLSVTHTDESVDRYVAVFEEMAAELTA